MAALHPAGRRGPMVGDLPAARGHSIVNEAIAIAIARAPGDGPT
jgi:hypothetical protein